jgi:ubiquinone biosynthesis protein
VTEPALLATSLAAVAGRIVLGAGIAVVTTSVSLRLLGTRRGWAKSLVAGFLGWGIAGLLALSLAHWDWGADGLLIQALAIGVPATMAVAVGLDLLARPGTLATGELAGLVVAPRLFQSIRTRVAVLRRYRQLVQLARREGFGPFLSAGARAGVVDDPPGVRMRRVLEEAGGVYVKLGQIAATRVDLLPPDICAELSKLQNRVPAEPLELIRPALEGELGASVDDVFAEFDWKPLAAASIGQTYRARLHSGDEVVVKVQRPGVQKIIERDLAALALIAGLAQRRTELGHGIRSAEMLDHFAKSLRAELDFRREADAMVEMDLMLGGEHRVRIPRVYSELCTRRLLVQELFEGSTVADTEELVRAGADRNALAQQLLRSTLDQVLKIGFFHADPHPGNVFALPDGTVGLIDFGAVGRLDSIQQGAVVDILAAFVQRDVGLLRNGIERVADIAESISPERLERALARLMADNMGPSGTIQPSVFQDLVAMLGQFGIRLPGDLVLLSRALITLDGTLRVLSPELSLVPAVTAMMMKAPAGEAVLDPETMVRDELMAALPRLRRLPDQIDRILTVTGRGDLRVHTVVDEDRQRILRTLVNRSLLTAIGFAFLVVSTLLVVAVEEGPSVATGAGLFEILGYGGLMAGTVLLLRVVAAVARDGTT